MFDPSIPTPITPRERLFALLILLPALLLVSCDEGTDPGDDDDAVDDDTGDDDTGDDDSADDDDDTAPLSSWELITNTGLGANNTRASGLAEFDGELYVGTINSVDRTQVFKHDGSGIWEQVNLNGFGGVNTAVQGITVFDGDLYVGTTNNSTGSEVLRYDSGTAWDQVNADGFTPDEPAMVARVLIEYDGNLYAGARNDTGGASDEDHENMAGAQVWRYDGGTDWTQVNENGFGIETPGYNRSVECMAVLDADLYAGTWNDDLGCQVWRYDGGTDWTQVNETAFAQDIGTTLSVALSMEVFDGELYVGTRNDNLGAEVWRYLGGTSWEPVGFRDANSAHAIAIWDLTGYDGKLYAGTMSDGAVWQYDGADWFQANDNGFGDTANNMVTFMTVMDDRLFAGTNAHAGDAQVWGSVGSL